MAATNNKEAWASMLSKLRAMGGVSNAVLGEPHSGYQSGLVMVIPMTGSIPETVLNAPRERHEVDLVRIEDVMKAPVDVVENRLDSWRAEILEDIWGDFDLGGNIAYPEPAETEWEFGHVTYESALYRFLDITLVYRIDPAATFVA